MISINALAGVPSPPRALRPAPHHEARARRMPERHRDCCAIARRLRTSLLRAHLAHFPPPPFPHSPSNLAAIVDHFHDRRISPPVSGVMPHFMLPDVPFNPAIRFCQNNCAFTAFFHRMLFGFSLRLAPRSRFGAASYRPLSLNWTDELLGVGEARYRAS